MRHVCGHTAPASPGLSERGADIAQGEECAACMTAALRRYRASVGQCLTCGADCTCGARVGRPDTTIALDRETQHQRRRAA